MPRGAPSTAILLLAASCLLVSTSLAWTTTTTKTKTTRTPFPVLGASSIATETESDGWFSTVDDNGANTNTDASGEGSLSTIGIDQLKIQLLQLGAWLNGIPEGGELHGYVVLLLVVELPGP